MCIIGMMYIYKYRECVHEMYSLFLSTILLTRIALCSLYSLATPVSNTRTHTHIMTQYNSVCKI